MKDYSKWTNVQSDSLSLMYDLADKEKIVINDNSVDIECIVNDANEWQKDVDKIFLIKKDVATVYYGDYIKYNNADYLVYFDIEDRDLFWSVKARRCNNIFTIIGDPTKQEIGKTPWGEPIYNEIPGQKYDYPCIVQSKQPNYDGSTDPINIIESEITITIKNVANDQLKIDKTFTMFGQQYKIFGFDYTNTYFDKGILHIKARLT
jgi:hypothetical protein